MDPKALELAKIKLRRAEKAMEDLRAATDFESAEHAWSDFLLASGNIFAKLEQGAKKNPRANAWFKDKKDERKNDHLLLYLHEARNSDEHGIERVTERHESGDGKILGRKPKFGERIDFNVYQVDQTTMQPIGEPIKAFDQGSFIKLVAIRYDRNAKLCEPPRMHLGADVKYYSWPQQVAELGLAYLRNLLVEAEGFV